MLSEYVDEILFVKNVFVLELVLYWVEYLVGFDV